MFSVFDVGPSGWGGASPTSPTVDNGTAAWGKTSDAPTGWGDPEDAGGKNTGWGNPPPNPIKSGEKRQIKTGANVGKTLKRIIVSGRSTQVWF